LSLSLIFFLHSNEYVKEYVKLCDFANVTPYDPVVYKMSHKVEIISVCNSNV